MSAIDPPDIVMCLQIGKWKMLSAILAFLSLQFIDMRFDFRGELSDVQMAFTAVKNVLVNAFFCCYVIIGIELSDRFLDLVNIVCIFVIFIILSITQNKTSCQVRRKFS